MAGVAGASRYLNQAILAQKTGASFSAGNVLSASVSSSLLDAGRGNAVRGIGLSARARAMTTSLLNSNESNINQMFSLTGGASATVDAAKIQIAGLRATVAASRDVLTQDDGSISSNKLVGNKVDTSA